MHPLAALFLGVLCITGLSQMVMGQVGKGFVILLSAMVLAVLTAGVGLIPIHIAVAVDAFMVATALQKGRHVGEWQFFPS